MTISSLVGPQIPLLRRYARALSGSQESGDAYVAALLETLLADPDTYDCAAEPREESYRLFSRVWNAVPLNGLGEGKPSPASVPDRRLEAITPLPRQAFLLTAVEGFGHGTGGAHSRRRSGGFRDPHRDGRTRNRGPGRLQGGDHRR